MAGRGKATGVRGGEVTVGGSGWRFALPWVVGVVLLTLLPAVASIGLSFTSWSGLDWSEVRWVGWAHYAELVGLEADTASKPYDPAFFAYLPSRPRDPRFYQAAYNTLVYSVAAVPLGLMVALGLAVLLDLRLRGMAFFRTMYYLPYVLGGVATAMVWSWLFNPKFGLVNGVLRGVYALLDPLVRWLGWEGTSAWAVPGWLYSPAWCKAALVVMHVWAAGGAMLIFLAALQTVPGTLYDAAALDGAGRRRRFRHVTLPQITPALMFNLVMGLVYSLQTFSPVFLLRNRAQQDGLLFYVLYLYECAFEEPHRLGYASAMAWLWFAVLGGLTLLTVRSGRWWVHYESEGAL